MEKEKNLSKNLRRKPMLDMPEKVQRTIAGYLNKITEVYNTSADFEITEELMPYACIYLDNEVNVVWPAKSMTEVKEALAKFAKRGIMIDKVVKSDTSPIWYLKGRNCRIRLAPCWTSDDNVSCKLVKVGEEMQPIYKLVCSEFPVEG
jgi:hypothetical protein